MITNTDQSFMEMALIEADLAENMGEVPVGAVLVGTDNEILARAGNNCIAAADPVGHAEIRVLREAARLLGNYRLPKTTLYVTLEPCPMCAAALVNARVKRVVFGATDPKNGALVSRYYIGNDDTLNHRLVVQGQVLEEKCSARLRDFFKKKRKAKSN